MSVLVPTRTEVRRVLEKSEGEKHLVYALSVNSVSRVVPAGSSLPSHPSALSDA